MNLNDRVDYTPDKWALVRVKNKTTEWISVLAGWSGGYTQGDSWKLSSAVESVQQDKEAIYTAGKSGSVYKLRLNSAGVTVMTASIYAQLSESQNPEEGITAECITDLDEARKALGLQ